MLGKVRRPITHRTDGSDPQPKAGLSDGRLSLVHRYMIDAEEAEARKCAAAEEVEARAGALVREREAQAAAAAEEQARREAVERELMRLDLEQLQAERARARAARSAPADNTFVGKIHSAASIGSLGFAPRLTRETGGLIAPDGEVAAEEVRQSDKRAARQAARRIAALEKKEARERRALAKAAMRRERAPRG